MIIKICGVARGEEMMKAVVVFGERELDDSLQTPNFALLRNVPFPHEM
jgi:hypothetical protein